MKHAGTRIMCDADSHIMETFDWLESIADPASATSRAAHADSYAVGDLRGRLSGGKYSCIGRPWRR